MMGGYLQRIADRVSDIDELKQGATGRSFRNTRTRCNEWHMDGSLVEVHFSPHAMVARKISVVGGIDNKGVFSEPCIVKRSQYLANAVVYFADAGCIGGPTRSRWTLGL